MDFSSDTYWFNLGMIIKFQLSHSMRGVHEPILTHIFPQFCFLQVNSSGVGPWVHGVHVGPASSELLGQLEALWQETEAA